MPAVVPESEAILMMGTKERSFAPLINVSLEELVPQDPRDVQRDF
jgi:hypothetical protein